MSDLRFDDIANMSYWDKLSGYSVTKIRRLEMREYRREWGAIDSLVGAIWRISSPGSLFQNAYVGYHFRGAVSYGEHVQITDVSSDPETLACGEDYLIWLRPRLAVHEGFVALRRHWAAMGVSGAYTGHDGYGGYAINWGIYVPREALPLLEQFAQDAVGLTSPAERERAARNFRIYMARHYENGWEENQKSMPAIDQSPYARTIE